jgi:anti-sigma B factor antagonist
MRNKELVLSVDVLHEIRTIVAAGPINSATSPQLRHEINDAFAQDSKAVVIEISQVHYIDSSALATLVEGMQLAEQKKKPFCLAGSMDPTISHLLEITHLEDLFPKYATLQEAIAALS